jgi:predicted restriction endonuclease
MIAQRANYRKLAFAHYEQLGQIVCAHCGFGIRDVLEVAHLDCDRSNNDVSNLVILCPTCHKMLDLDLITTATIILMRDRRKVVVWAKRMKDAGKKAAESRRKTAEKLKWKRAGEKAAATRKRNADRSGSQ